MKKHITIYSGCYNEEENIRNFYARVTAVMTPYSDKYDWDIIVADNCSQDGTRAILRELAAKDKRFKVIMNANNFGALRSGANIVDQLECDASVGLCSDLQDPPELIPQFIEKWEEGYKVVCAVKTSSKENPLVYAVRKLYYTMLRKSSETELIDNYTGFGLCDRCVIDAVKRYNDPYPYFRGLISEIGFRRCEIPYCQDKRQFGKSTYNFFRYYDYAMTGFVNYTKLPLRLAVFSGFILAGLSLLTALGYLIYKLLYWNTFQLGLAPLVVGLFFFSAVQLIFIGIIGEYIGAIWTHVKRKPYVIEEEKINFDDRRTDER